MSTWRDDVQLTLREIGGQASLEDLYRAFSERRTRSLPPSWRAIIRRELEYNSTDSDSYQGRYDLFYSVSGIGGGVWGLRELRRATPVAVDIVEPPANRTNVSNYRILRDTPLARDIKRLHKDRCQLCGEALLIADNLTYSEAHHIKPLGVPHNGPDVSGNILVLCPNHHALCDFGGVKLARNDLTVVAGHAVDEKFIAYHNTHIYRSQK